MTKSLLERLEERKLKLENEIRKLKARESKERRKLDTRRKIVTGAAVLEHAKNDKQFDAFLMQLLDKKLKRKADRELFDLDNEENDNALRN
jgi:NCAIR mutase (PurE)-related protein